MREVERASRGRTYLVAPLIACVAVVIASAESLIDCARPPGGLAPAFVVLVGLLMWRAERFRPRAALLVRPVSVVPRSVPALKPLVLALNRCAPGLDSFAAALSPCVAVVSPFAAALNGLTEPANECAKTLVGRAEALNGPVAAGIAAKRRRQPWSAP